jgi:hypothetical protein
MFVVMAVGSVLKGRKGVPKRRVRILVFTCKYKFELGGWIGRRGFCLAGVN